MDFTYDDAGRYDTISRYADLAAADLVAVGDYEFDSAGRLTALTYTQPNSTGLPFYGWEYDAAGRMTHMESLDGEVDYSNDDAGQLTGADYTGGQGDEGYSYDDVGNRDNYTIGPCNQILCDGTYHYEYDFEGNRILKYVDEDESESLTDGDTDVTYYTWDHRNRLTEATHYAELYDVPPGPGDMFDWQIYYCYDAFDRLVDRQYTLYDVYPVYCSHEAFVYDGLEIALRFSAVDDGEDPTMPSLDAADLSNRYLWNPQAVDQLMADEQIHWDAQAEDFVTDELLWALTDQINSVRDLAIYNSGTDSTAVANHRVFSAFGKLISETNSLIVCAFGWTGRYYDPVAKIQNNLENWYDAELGTWLICDKAFSDVNPYRYCGNSPLTHVDPLGLSGMNNGIIFITNPNDNSNTNSGGNDITYVQHIPGGDSDAGTHDPGYVYYQSGGNGDQPINRNVIRMLFQNPYLRPDGGTSLNHANGVPRLTPRFQLVYPNGVPSLAGIVEYYQWLFYIHNSEPNLKIPVAQLQKPPRDPFANMNDKNRLIIAARHIHVPPTSLDHYFGQCEAWANMFISAVRGKGNYTVEQAVWVYPMGDIDQVRDLIGLPFGVPSGTWRLRHVAAKVTFDNGEVVYFDNGWWGGSFFGIALNNMFREVPWTERWWVRPVQ